MNAYIPHVNSKPYSALERSNKFQYKWPEAEFKEFKPRLKSAKTRFKLSAGLNFETFDTILTWINHI